MTEEKIIEELKKLAQLMERMGDLHKATVLNNALELIKQLQHKHALAVAEREANVKGFTEELAKAKTEGVCEMIDEMTDTLRGEIDTEDNLGRDAWENGDTVGKHIHEYAENKLENLQIALSLYKNIYKERADNGGS